MCKQFKYLTIFDLVNDQWIIDFISLFPAEKSPWDFSKYAIWLFTFPLCRIFFKRLLWRFDLRHEIIRHLNANKQSDCWLWLSVHIIISSKRKAPRFSKYAIWLFTSMVQWCTQTRCKSLICKRKFNWITYHEGV